MNLHDWMLRLRALLWRTRVERDLEDEVGFHIEMETRKNVEAGMGAAEAARRAQVEFGAATQIKEECREARGLGLIEATWQDARYAARSFRRSPVLVLTVVATIGLGLGLDTALFTIFDATYLRPIGVRDAGSLYEAYWRDRAGEGHDFSPAEYRGFLAANAAFSGVLGYTQTVARLDGREMPGSLVTGGYFEVLGVGAALGRTALTDGDQAALVLSYRAWQSRFSGDPEIVGRKIILRGYPFEVVGVAAAGFTGVGGRPSEFWAPLAVSGRLGMASPREITVVGRLRDGFSARQAAAGLTVWAQQLTRDEPGARKAMRGELLSRASTKPLRVTTALGFSPILAAFSVVLLMGCANVSNMMLARSLARRREIGIRLALGAGRGRLIRQLLTESLLLALPAAVAGVAVSEASIRICLRVLLATLPPDVAGIANRFPELHSDWRVFGFALAVAMASSVAFGLAPALQATRRESIRLTRPERFRGGLVLGQVTTCVVLLVTAGILLRGVERIHGLDAGLSSRNTIQMVVQEKSREAVLGRLAAEPAVETIAAAESAPVERKAFVTATAGEGGTIPHTATNHVSPEYFAMYEIALVRGRNFTAGEGRTGAAVAIVSETAARRLWAHQDALGKVLQVDAGRSTAVTVVGVARDELSRSIGNSEDPSLIYFPSSAAAVGNQLFASVRGPMAEAARKIEAELAAMDPQAVERVGKLQIREWVEEDAYYTFRVAYWVASAIGVLALLLTLSGIYGVLSYVVTQRTQEIGIRMAMGATSGSVTGLVLKQSMRLAGAGAAAGCVLAMGMAKVLASFVVAVDPFAVWAYAGGVALVMAGCAAAAYLPARRAARIDPLTTLRYD